MIVKSEYIDKILSVLESKLGHYGLEFHAFKVLWYNSLVEPAFRLPGDEESIAFLVVSAPRMFENAFLPFLKSKKNELSELKDPIDECMQSCLSVVPELFSDYKVNIVHDFELDADRKPKIIMQCAAHASGAAHLYHPSQLNMVIDEKDKKMYGGVCLHSKYSVWFAPRAVIFLEDLLCPTLYRMVPIDGIPTRQQRYALGYIYNRRFQEFDYFKDFIHEHERYSPLQMTYFCTPVGDRQKLIDDWCKSGIF